MMQIPACLSRPTLPCADVPGYGAIGKSKALNFPKKMMEAKRSLCEIECHKKLTHASGHEPIAREVEEDRRGEANRIHAIHHAAMTLDHGAPVLGAEAAFDSGQH